MQAWVVEEKDKCVYLVGTWCEVFINLRSRMVLSHLRDRVRKGSALLIVELRSPLRQDARL